MKPLDLRVYEKHPTLDAYRFGPSYTPYAIVSVDKRFSDAELAAEYHKAAGDMDTDFFANHEQENPSLMAKEDALLRFATLPHFDEDAQ